MGTFKGKSAHVVLGINEGHDAAVSLVVDGELVAAYEEERFSRKKMHNGMGDGLPFRGLQAILADYALSRTDIDAISFNFPGMLELHGTIFSAIVKDRCAKWVFAPFDRTSPHKLLNFFAPAIDVVRKRYKLKDMLRKNGLVDIPLTYVDHHTCHAASAYYGSGWKDALVLTLDGQGDGLSGSVFVGHDGRLVRKEIISKYNSVGMLYSTITKGLGFRPNRHEGKILGLAAFGTPAKYKKRFEALIENKGLGFNLAFLRKYPAPYYPHYTSLGELFAKEIAPWYEGDRENLCAALQVRTEEVVLEWVRRVHATYPSAHIAVAGGVFSNVKVNQKISELPFVEHLFVFPAMNDGGLSSGSALYASQEARTGAFTPVPLVHTYLGRSSTDEEIKAALDGFGLIYTTPTDIHDEVARLLDEGKVVARMNGRAEYGPRALGARSMLYNGRDATVNTWLNKKLDRTEFMPFAPSVLAEDASRYFENVKSGAVNQPASFMTITYDCKELAREHCPAAVHVDNTARPQFVQKETNPDFHGILSAYKKRSGSSVVVNTSFNVHEEPIVQSPKDAIKSFLITRIDALAIGKYLVMREGQQ